MPTEIALKLETAAYQVVVGRGLISGLGDQLRKLEIALPRDCALITDSTVQPLYAARVRESLEAAGFSVTLLVVPAGEASKNIAQAGDLCDQMIRAGLGRKSFVVALGGGVVGDLAGFVAGIFCRGVPVIQLPTTVMAQVDSSVGGKTGVNAPSGKNLIGVFHQPAAVFADVDTLSTLPPREFCEGFAEVIKHGCIRDAQMLEILETRSEGILPSSPARQAQNNQAPPETSQAGNRGREKSGAQAAENTTPDEGKMPSLRNNTPPDEGKMPSLRDADLLEDLVARNVAIKARVVMNDEKETTGERALLNFGHTLGHGIEAAAGYGKMLHGEAISLGMVAALNLSVSKAGLSEVEKTRVIMLLKKFDLPTRLPDDIADDAILQAMKADKKFDAGAIRFVLLPRLGEAVVSKKVTLQDIQAVLADLREPAAKKASG